MTFRKLGFRFPDRRSIDTAGFGDPSRKQVLQLVQIRGARQLITATYVYEHPQVGRVVLEDGNDQAARAAFEAIIAEHFSGNDTSEWIEVRYTRLERR